MHFGSILNRDLQNCYEKTSECLTRPSENLTESAWHYKTRKRKSSLKSRRLLSRARWYNAGCTACLVFDTRLQNLLSAGCSQGHGQITRQKQTCCDQDVRSQIPASGSLPKDTGLACNLALESHTLSNIRSIYPSNLYVLQTLKSTQAMADAMRGATKVVLLSQIMRSGLYTAVAKLPSQMSVYYTDCIVQPASDAAKVPRVFLYACFVHVEAGR